MTRSPLRPAALRQPRRPPAEPAVSASGTALAVVASAVASPHSTLPVSSPPQRRARQGACGDRGVSGYADLDVN